MHRKLYKWISFLDLKSSIVSREDVMALGSFLSISLFVMCEISILGGSICDPSVYAFMSSILLTAQQRHRENIIPSSWSRARPPTAPRM